MSWYNATGNAHQISSWTNSTGAAALITGVTCQLGVAGDGVVFQTPDKVTGTGSPIVTNISILDATSDSKTVSNTVSALGASGAEYPNSADFNTYTFTFSPVIEVAAGASVAIYISTSSNTVLCGSDDVEVTHTPATKYYKVVYDANGGSFGGTTTETVSVAVGQNISLSDGNNLETPYYKITFNAGAGSISPSSKTIESEFQHWNTVANGSGVTYQPDETYSSAEETTLTLYAQYSAQLGNLPDPTPPNNYTFDGWYYNGIKVTATATISNDITLTAQYLEIIEETFSITYIGNGGYLTGNEVSVTDVFNVGDSAAIRGVESIVNGSKTCTVTLDPGSGSVSPTQRQFSCLFDSWNTAADGSGTSYHYGDTVSLTANTNLRLYAQYDPYILQDGDLPDPTPPGDETFAGWSPYISSVSDDITLTATYTTVEIKSPIWIMTGSGWVPFTGN